MQTRTGKSYTLCRLPVRPSRRVRWKMKWRVRLRSQGWREGGGFTLGLSRTQLELTRLKIKEKVASRADVMRLWAQGAMARRFQSVGLLSSVEPHTIPDGLSGGHGPHFSFESIQETFRWKDPDGARLLSNRLVRWGLETALGGMYVTEDCEWVVVNPIPWCSCEGPGVEEFHLPACHCRQCRPGDSFLGPLQRLRWSVRQKQRILGVGSRRLRSLVPKTVCDCWWLRSPEALDYGCESCYEWMDRYCDRGICQAQEI